MDVAFLTPVILTSTGLAPIPGELLDTFQTVGNLGGVALTPYGGATWTQDAGTGGGATNPRVQSQGSLQVNNGGGVTTDAIWVGPAAATAARWNTARLNPSYAISTAAAPQDFTLLANPVVILANTNYAVISHTWEAAGAGLGATFAYHSTTGGLQLQTTQDVYPVSSEGVRKSGSWLGVWPGDTVQVRKVTAAAAVTFDYYHNGYLVASNTVDQAAVYTAAGQTLNDRFGVKGNAQTNTPNIFSHVATGDPATQAALTVKRLGHTGQIKWWDGSNDVYERPKGEYSGQAPDAIYYSLINTDTGAVVSGPTLMSGLTTTAPVSGVGTWSGAGITFPAGSVPTNYCVKYERRDVTGNQIRFAFTPKLNAGWNVGIFGQSLMTQMWQLNVSGITVAPPAKGWVCDGSIDQGGTTFPGSNADFRVNLCSSASPGPYDSATSSTTYMMQPLVTASGNANLGVTVIRGGMGATIQTSRQPNAGHGVYEAFRDGIERAGDIGVLIFDGGTFEINGATDQFGLSLSTFTYGTDTVTYKAQLDTFLTAIEAYVGHPVRMILSPPPGLDATNTTTLNNRSNALARANWELIQTNGGFGTVTSSNPQRYYQGAFGYDLQHAPGDQYHLAITTIDARAGGYGEEARRWGYTLAKVCGYAANDRRGPSIDDTTTIVRTGTTIAVTFNLNGATTMAISGTAFASDFRGGMHFYKTGTSTEIFPTLTPSVGSPSGGKVTVTWTFAGGDLGTAVDVTGPAGLAPFNQSQDATVLVHMFADASVLRGSFTDPEASYIDPPVQPYFNGSFLTNNTHDFVTSN